MKNAFALFVALLFVVFGSLGAATIELHATNGKAPKQRATAPLPATVGNTSVPNIGNVIATIPTQEPVMGWLAIRRGLPEAELKRQLGVPRVIENKGDYELWRFVTGAVWVKEHKVAAWIQVILD